MHDTEPVPVWVVAALIVEGRMGQAEKAINLVVPVRDKAKRKAAVEGLELAGYFLGQKILANQGLAESISAQKEGKDDKETLRNMEGVIASLKSHGQDLSKLSGKLQELYGII